MGKRLFHLRTLIQLLVSALTNGYALGFVRGSIFTGWSKQFCLPGLNCYSCPGALGSCPVGALQAVLGSRKFGFSFYMAGFFLLVGSALGRLVCGFACPFGLVQDLLHKIPLPKIRKRKTLPGHRWLKYLKYVVLAGVVALPLLWVDAFGQGAPQFCKWICPSGTLLGGWTLTAVNAALRQSTAGLFAFKSSLCILILLCAIIVHRPFCKYLCPLGALYAPFNRIALVRLRVDEQKCTRCGACAAVCPMALDPARTPISAECIRCGACVCACSQDAIGLYHYLYPHGTARKHKYFRRGAA